MSTIHLTRVFAKVSASARSRLIFLHNPALPRSDPGWHTRVSSLFSHLLYKDLFSQTSPSSLLHVIALLSEASQEEQILLEMPSSFVEVTGGITLADIDKDDYRRYIDVSRLVAEEVGLVPGTTGLVINGRVRVTASVPFPKRDVPRCRSLAPSHLGNSMRMTTYRSRIMSWRGVFNPFWMHLGTLVPLLPVASGEC